MKIKTQKVLAAFHILFFLLLTQIFPQNLSVTKIEPPNWWRGMKLNKVQLMLYGTDLDSISIRSPNLNIGEVNLQKNKNYSLVTLQFAENIAPGIYNLIVKKRNDSLSIKYPILKRDTSKWIHRGFNDSDVIYLIFPDRFDDGDYSNDTLKNKFEQFKFGSLNGRHGGDIQGIINRLDYLKNLGVTSLWITPMLVNNMWMSYHGYAATDLYNIDPRFGSNQLYKKLVNLAHSKGLKIIMDHVSNHIGVNHHWVKYPPMPDWFNGTVQNHLPAHHDKLAFIDIHGDSTTYLKTIKGWFTDYMPDLKQANPFVANYLIQNTIWWTEYLGIDGIREDTYSYCDQKYLSNWAKAILDEYPHFNIAGEIWKGDPAFLAKYQRDSFFPRKFNSNLPAVFDFALSDALRSYLSGTGSFQNIYEVFAKDFVYSNPENLVTFVDNHDIDRALYLAKGNIKKLKIALTILLTSRGIPQLFYGTEIGMDGGGEHGKIRAQFPGGFPNDSLNAFTEEGRTEKQNNLYNFVSKLLHLRKNYKALSIGKMIHFPPKDGIYVYLKKYKDENFIVIINSSDKTKKVLLTDYGNDFANVNNLYDLLSDKTVKIDYVKSINIPNSFAKVYKY